MKEWHFPYADNFKLSKGFFRNIEAGKRADVPGVMFIGDSHIEQYWPSMELLLTNQPGNCRPVMFVTAGGTPALPGVNRLAPGFSCDLFFNFAVNEASKPDVGTVVFGCFWENYFMGMHPGGVGDPICRATDASRTALRLNTAESDLVFAEFGKTISRLTAMHKTVYVVGPSPSSRYWNPLRICRYNTKGQLWEEHSITRSELNEFYAPLNDLLTSITLTNGGRFIDPLDSFERNNGFSARDDRGRFYYKDGHHMRPFYVMERVHFFDPLILLPEKAAK